MSSETKYNCLICGKEIKAKDNILLEMKNCNNKVMCLKHEFGYGYNLVMDIYKREIKNVYGGNKKCTSTK